MIVTIFYLVFSLIQLAGADLDCYYKYSDEGGNSTCEKGFSRLPDIFHDEQFMESNRENASVGIFCCPNLKHNERIGQNRKPFLWPNELKGTLTRAFMSCHATNIPGLDTIRFLLYTKKTNGLFDYEELYINDEYNLAHSHFMKNAPIKIIIHGFMSSAFVGPAPALRAAYSKIPEPLNIIAVHWEPLANLVTTSDGICYDIASKSTKYVGRKTALLIEFLIQNNYTTLDKVHVLGHSLGSHCAGFVGKYLKIGKLPRLTAFDPARPAFEDKPPEERLAYTDAEFIDVIHTATKQWKLLGTISFGFLPFPVGIKAPLGHSDFYPNYGTHQPGCVLQFQKLPVLCSHSRSYFYYADSIRYRNERIFLATECDNLEDLEKGVCSKKSFENDTQVVMGEYTPEQNITRKLFYVKTNARSPFPLTMIKSQ